MTNRIRDVAVINHRLDPHETELRVHVEVEGLTPTTEIRGRLTGPRCVYSSTIEIAYPLREVQRNHCHVEFRVVIPEASWWEPETPFLYYGVIERFENGLQNEMVRFHHGIRLLQLTPNGLRLNGTPYQLHGILANDPMNERDATRIRSDGDNVVLACPPENGFDFWTYGDRFGFFVIGTTGYAAEFLRWSKVHDRSASAFGWALSADILQEIQCAYQLPISNTVLLGVHGPHESCPINASFAACVTVAEIGALESSFPKLLSDHDVSPSILRRRDVIGLIKPWW